MATKNLPILVNLLRAGQFSGDIMAKKINKEASAKTTAGNISLKSCSASVVARSVAGDIHLDHISQNVDAKTTAGNITVTLRGLLAKIRAQSMAGKVRNHTQQSFEPSAPTYKLSSTAGNITINP